jgi:hypothetical protein
MCFGSAQCQWPNYVLETFGLLASFSIFTFGFISSFARWLFAQNGRAVLGEGQANCSHIICVVTFCLCVGVAEITYEKVECP